MKKLFSLSLLVLGAYFSVLAQTAHMHGTIADSNGNVLIGATVYFPGLEKGAVSDSKGKYEFTELPYGNQQVVVSFIGFETETQQIVVNSAEIVHDFSLNEKAVYLDGLVVTAQKREQSIKDIPTAISSLDAKFLENNGITTLDDLSEYVPGMQVQLQSPNNPGFVIRGITSDDGSSNVEPRVSVFQDGVSISKSRGSVVEVYDMERVEILKGPQGTLFGRGAQIGAVHFIQNKAKNNTSGSVAAGYGDYNYTHAEGFFNTPLVKDKLFVRVAGIYKKRDGYIENLSGGDLNGKDTKAFRTSLRFMPSDKTTFDLIYNYQHDTPPGTAFKSGTYAPAGGDTDPWTFADLEAGEDLGVDRTVWGTTLISKHNYSDNFNLTSTTAYREFDSYELFDADGTAAPALLLAEDAFGKQFSQEFRVNFKISDRFEGFGGASYFYENGRSNVPLMTNEQSLAVLMSPLVAPTVNASILTPINQVLAGYGITDGMTMQSVPLVTDGVPNYVTSLAGLITNSQYLAYIASAYPSVYSMLTSDVAESHTESYTNYGKNQAYEFFVDGTYKLTDWFSLTGGLRLTFEDIESSFSAATDPDGNNGTLGFARSAGLNDLYMPTDKVTESDNYTSMVGRLALNFKVTDQLESYFNLSRGRRPNVIQFEMVPANDGTYTSTYEPEKLSDEIVWSYEAGLKGLSKNQHLYYDFAAFYYDYSNFQTQTVDESLQLVTKDAGNATAYGVETSLKWQINRIWQLFGNYAYIHARFDDTDSDGNAQEYAGNTFRLTPAHSFSFGFNCTVPLSQSVAVFVTPTYNYKSKVYFEEDNGDDVMQDGFGLLNFRGGVSLPKSNLLFQGFLTNALDEKYIIDAGNTGRNFGIPTYIAGPPRMFGLEIRYSF
ncbi:TonB-dependent receptor [Mangrovibacterium diazotrophicum]|uniref:Outer membrane receptor protein involved in Fe transport n=1 Tax=Mangrovibacterium diazotrophicum TaxID=1261403 RepID=A0A419W5J9_9BACT|nr:TonB-dependent receptor [Mangrovibacterium diazotrophicum]RKD90715.1 outer membrane receptor protein involved in Fe transport [Mangrovibacterium diazotrophicum]